jgi:hypothetical protein
MIVAGVGDLVQKIGDGRTGRVLGGWAIERSGGVVCGLHLARGHYERGFLGWALKPRSMICEWFDLKTTRTVFTSLVSKPVATVSTSLAPKLVAAVFSSLVSKLVLTVSPSFTGGRFLGWASKPRWWRVS